MSEHKTLVKNTLIIAIGKVMTQFLTFLLLPLYTAYLTTDEFGAVDMTITYVSLLAPIVALQLEMATFRFLVDSRKNESQKATVISSTFRVLLLGLVVLATIYAIASTWFVIPYGWLPLFVIVATSIANMLMQMARGLGDNIAFSIGGVISGLVAIIINIVLIAGLGWGAESLLVALLAGNTAAALFVTVRLRLRRYIKLSAVDSVATKELLKYALPLIPNGASWWAINALDRTIITIVLGIASNGIYAIAYKFPQVFMSLFSFFGMSWTESASVNIKSKNRDTFFSGTMNASVRMFGSLAAVMIVLLPIAFPLLVNTEFQGAYQYIPLLIIGAFMNSIVGLYSAIYVALKQTKQVLSTSLTAAVISIATTLALIHSLGLFAPALAMVVSYGAMAVIRHRHISRTIQICYSIKMIAVLVLLFIGAIAAYFAPNFVWYAALALLVLLGVAWFNFSTIKLGYAFVRKKLAVKR